MYEWYWWYAWYWWFEWYVISLYIIAAVLLPLTTWLAYKIYRTPTEPYLAVTTDTENKGAIKKPTLRLQHLYRSW